MSDLVERLRLRSGPFQDGLWKQAADRIEELEKALREIAKQQTTYEFEGDDGDFEEEHDAMINIARATLNGDKT